MRKLFWSMPILGACALGIWLNHADSAPSQGNQPSSQLQPVQSLPITRVILFNSGVGHFTRSGEITNDARIDLTFPEQDINDLIKSMVLEDMSEKGRISAVTYDSRDPIDRTLKSFAINLNNSPTFPQILTQARGEKVEVTMLTTAVGQPGTLQGSIMGVEKKKEASKDGSLEVDVINLWCAEGVRSIKLNDIARLRFSNPVIENEIRRALETLALSHDSQKKAVSLNFSGEGKRKVRVSYVIENPIWKTSYRLVLSQEGKPYLQGWAVVENATDEDWHEVGMGLISGRPISFKMDLYNPLYVQRPMVEPELFASLRPPTYAGGFANQKEKSIEMAMDEMPMKALGGRSGGEGKGSRRGTSAKDFDMLQERKKQVMDLASDMNKRMDVGRAAPSVATASQLGDYFQYLIDVPVSLGRQKSALLPIVNKDIDGQRVSIYNPNVQAKHPLLGLKFKNTAGMNLSQGPITVFEGSTYAGDTRILDVQKNEERLVSYAIDLGTEVSAKNGNNTSRITKVRAHKGIIYTETLIREEKVYDIVNRTDKDRVLLIEHPNRKGQGFKFTGKNQPSEETADLFRFESKIASGKTVNYSVVEERSQGTQLTLSNSPDDQIRWFINLNEASESLKGKLREALGIKATWDNSRRELENINRRIQTITQDQNRIRQNLREVPKESKAYKTYLTKFDEQETEMTSLHEKLKEMQKQEEVSRKRYEEFLSNLTVE